MKKEDPRLQGLCKECTHRKSCADAKRHLNMIGCSRYRHWKKKSHKAEVPQAVAWIKCEKMGFPTSRTAFVT